MHLLRLCWQLHNSLLSGCAAFHFNCEFILKEAVLSGSQDVPLFIYGSHIYSSPLGRPCWDTGALCMTVLDAGGYLLRILVMPWELGAGATQLRL